MTPVLEVLRIPFSRAVPWYGANSIRSLKPFQQDTIDDDKFLLGGWKTTDNESTTTTAQPCVLYLHGFPDQSVDHRRGVSTYGSFRTRMARKLSDSFDRFCAFNFSGSPGSNGISFYDKTVTQEVWDVLNVMRYLSKEKEITGVHIVGLSTGAIIGSLLRGVSDPLRHQLELAPILSISVIASCGAASSNEAALEFDFDPEQRRDFDELGHCWKQFWLPRGNSNNPQGAVLKDPDNSHGEEEEEDKDERWVPHLLKLGCHYRDDFLKLPIRKHLANHQIPLLVIHGKADKNVPFEQGRAVYEAASEPKRFVEIPKGNHLLTNSKDLKKAIRAIKEWHKLCESTNPFLDGIDQPN